MRLARAKLALIAGIVHLSTIACLPASAGVEVVEQADLGKQLRLPIMEWHDAGVPTNGVILALHGLTLHSTTFDTTARFLSSRGYRTYGLDFRGMGRWQTEPEKFHGKSTMDFSLCKSDVIRTLKRLNEMYPDKPIFCMGESYGATLSAYVAEKEPALVDGIIVSSFCDKRLWKHPMLRMIPDAVRGFGIPFVAVSLRPYTSKLLSTDPLVTQRYLEDPLIVKAITAPRLVKTLADNKRISRRINKIQVPILVLSGGKDGTKQPEPMPKFLRKINPDQLQYRSLAKQGHLLLECQPKMHPDTAAVLQAWLKKETSQQIATQPPDRAEAPSKN
jgi:alpha-beta hydrolase superfamily lysophospholipase